MKRPAFQFYPGDYLRDLALRTCSVGARGVWWDMVCLMHDGTPYGHLRVSAKDILPPTLARIVGVPLPELEGYLAELEESGVFARTAAGTIYSRRMVRDEEIRQARAAGGHKSIQHPNVPKPKAEKDILHGYPSRRSGRVSSPASFDPSPSSSFAGSSLTTPPPSPPLGADAPKASQGVALTVHRNGNGNRHLPSRRTRQPAPTMQAVQTRLATLMADMRAEADPHHEPELCRRAMVDLVFAYWAAKLHHEDSRLDTKRFQTIRARLYQAEDNVHMLLFAVDGALKDDTVMGRKHDSSEKWDRVSTIFRDYEQVERLAEKGGYRSGKLHPMAVKHLEPILHPLAVMGSN